MRIRTSFISNSSSTSYIVWGNQSPQKQRWLDTTFVIGELGHCEFGWENTTYDSVYDKINFAWLQAHYVHSNYYDDAIASCKELKYKGYEKSIEYYTQAKKLCQNNWMEMLYDVLREYFQVDCITCILNLECSINDKKIRYAYIDHQSSSHEGQNTEIFESKEKLAQFLFGNDTYIQGGNDNEWD